MLSVQQTCHHRIIEKADMKGVIRQKEKSTCSATTPPLGPEPLRLCRQEVDELYNLLSTVLITLNELEIPHLVAAESLLGAVRSQSILFDDDKIDIAIIEEDSDGVNYQILLECLPFMISNAAEERSKFRKTEIQYTFLQRPCTACDRIKSSAAPRVWINLFVLRKYQTEKELVQILEENRGHRSIGYVNSILNAVGNASFPLYHYDNQSAIEGWPKEYFYPSELFPLKPLNFGPLQIPGPNHDVLTLRRFYGNDCFTHYKPANEKGIVDRTSLEDGTEKIPLSEEQYLPIQHSNHDKRVWTQHCKKSLQIYIANQGEGDIDDNQDVPFSVVNVTDCSQSLEISPILDHGIGMNFGLSAPPRLDSLSSPEDGPPSTLPKPSGLTRKKSVYSMPATVSVSTASTSSSTISIEEPQPTKNFGRDIREVTANNSGVLEFDKELRQVMEPYIREARINREKSRIERLGNALIDDSISSTAGVPYTSLRTERRFLFDDHTYPIHQVLAETIGVQDLSKLHEHEIQDIRFLLAPLLDRNRRRSFHQCYDNFVTSFCIPLLHSIAMTKNIFHTTSATASTKIVYRYQAFPCIRVIRPGEYSIEPHCDTAYGHSIGDLKFHVPLTAAYGTNALYTETHPGREDWHPLTTKALGLGYIFDGARCLHYSPENTTDQTRVSLEFRIAIYREDHSNSDVDGGLCSESMLEDQYSKAGPGYYDEAIIDIGVEHNPFAGPVIIKKFGNRLRDPDKRNGFPFTK